MNYIALFNVNIMSSYCCCVLEEKKCVIIKNYSRYIHFSTKCNLIILSAELNHIRNKLLQLQREKQKTKIRKQKLKIKKERLHKQITLLKKQQTELVQTELYNIKKLETEKVSINLSLFSCISDSLLLSLNFRILSED